MNNYKYSFYNNFLILTVISLLLTASLLAKNQSVELEVGEILHYDVTFGGILRGNTVISFYGKVTSFIKFDTTYILTSDTANNAASDSNPQEEITDDSSSSAPANSVEKNLTDSIYKTNPESLMVVKAETTNIYYITYDTKFIGNIYNLHADIYTRNDFFPLLIETKIKRPGKLSHGRELFYPDRNMAIFSQVIENQEEVDTIQRKYSLQDITTLPFYFSKVNLSKGDTLNISLPQGEYKLTRKEDEKIEMGEGEDFVSYDTYRIVSKPEGFKVWLNERDKIPVKVDIESQKIKMVLKKKMVNRKIRQNKIGNINEEKVRAKLFHILKNFSF